MDKQHCANTSVTVNINLNHMPNEFPKNNEKCNNNKGKAVKNKPIFVTRNEKSPSVNRGSHKYKHLSKSNNAENDFDFLDFDKIDLSKKTNHQTTASTVRQKFNLNNRSQQLNSNNKKYWKSRDFEFVDFEDIEEYKEPEKASNSDVISAGEIIASAIIKGSLVIAKSLSENKQKHS